MAYPSILDDGRTVVLDLHGATVDEAVALTRRTIAAAARRGRSGVKVIHGSSTSRIDRQNRTIKHAILALLDDGTLSPEIASAWRAEGHFLLSLPLGRPVDSAPIRMTDIIR